MAGELKALQQKQVDFYGDELDAVRGEDGQIYVSIRQMCTALGIDTQGQTQRIRRHDVLADGEMVCELHTIQGLRPTNVLRTDLVPLWLSGIRVKSVAEDIQPKLKRFQKEAAKVLWEAFQSGRLTSEFSVTELVQSDTPAAQAWRLGQAIMQLAEQQMLFEARTSSRLDVHEQRLENIESLLGRSERIVTGDEAMQISQSVKLIAHELGQRSGRNEYGGVYGELYRRFGITSYKSLPAAKFEEAMNFLTQWHSSLVDEGSTPF